MTKALQEIHDEHRTFCLTGKEFAEKSYKESEKNASIHNINISKDDSRGKLWEERGYQRYIESLQSQESSIIERALNGLEFAGYDKTDRGTQYLAALITIFYHEKDFYHGKDFRDKSYWNLEDWDNEHYGMMGVPKEREIYDILTANSHNPDLSCPFEETVYQIADSLGSRKYDESKRESVGYVDLLHKRQSTKKNNRH